MKAHFETSLKLFKRGCKRALELRAIHEYLRNAGPAALDCDDILRSAVVLAVSSFDLFVHDIYRLEALDRLQKSKGISAFRVPFDALLKEGADRHSLVDQCIRRDHAFKSFVAPDKLADCLKPFVERPWEKFASFLNVKPEVCKDELRRVVALRNRIAHEADVNPDLGGVELWPIYSEDVEISIQFLQRLAFAVAQALDQA